MVNHVVEGSELLKKARQIAEAMIKNNQDLVLRYKAVINDGFKQDLAHALTLEKVRICFFPSLLLILNIAFFCRQLSSSHFEIEYCLSFCSPTDLIKDIIIKKDDIHFF